MVVVNESFARTYLPGVDPLGRKLRHPAFFGESYPTEHEIVGVVEDVRPDALADARPQMFFLHRQVPWPRLGVVVRAADEPAALAASSRERIWALDPTVPLDDLSTMEQLIDRSVASPCFHMRLVGSLAALALVLAAVGIYGVLSYAVAERTREIGLRMALGASWRSVFGMVLRRGLGLTLLGIGLGLVGAMWAAQALRALLAGVSATEPLALTAAVAILGAVALAACVAPALRALRVDPMTALRSE